MVELIEKTYFGKAAFTALNAELAQNINRKIFFLVDENTHEFCLPKVLEMLPDLPGYEVLEIEPGEESKSVEIASSLWAALAQLGADRNSILINVGGGVITDLGGFIAATYKRGIGFYNIPTSLLAMVDAAIGGKTGVDVEGIKNLAGTFSTANGLYIHSEFLQTLPKNQLVSGFAEVLKHTLITGQAHWNDAIENFENNQFNALISQSVKIKQDIVALDKTEGGQRKLLNYGHTLGHAVESFFLENGEPILHGEAIAAGMIMANKISVQKGMLPQDVCNEIERVLLSYFPKLNWDEAYDEHILKWLAHDKKNEGDSLKFVLLNQIGNADFNVDVTYQEAAEALVWYREKRMDS